MKLKLLIFFVFIVSMFSGLKAQSYDVLNYAFNGTPTYGIKIKTNMPVTDGSQMPNVRIEGYNYGQAKTIGINLTWYIYYGGSFIQYSASSFGGYTFPIKLSNENGKVVIFIEDRNYYNRFKVSVYANGMGEPASWFSGWTTTDEPLNGTNTVDVLYRNSFSGNVGIGTNNPQTTLDVNGTLQALTSTNPIRFTSVWSGFPDGVQNQAEISNDVTGYKTLMIVGNQSAGMGRRVSVWDRLEVNGSFLNTGNAIFNSNVGIGTTNPTEKLAVNGNIRAKKLIVTQNGWPDYVFSKNYKLKPLNEVDQFIKTNNHLPDMPSAKDVEEKGLDIGKTQAALLKKIEELTLYVIELKKESERQSKQLSEQANFIRNKISKRK
jgi:hypothetical protein